MQLNLQQMQEIVTGAVRTEAENGTVSFYRFTKEEEALYKETNQDFYIKSFSTAGTKFLFKTNSEHIFLKATLSKGSSRQYFSFDVFVNGKAIDCMDNFSDRELTGDYTKSEFPLGTFSKTFSLGGGEKTVCIHFPWSVRAGIKEISLDDGAFVEAVKPEKTLLAYGDSITHGYDALRPSNRYIAKLAERLGAEEYNKAIGGEMFFPPLALLGEAFTPDYITVAYGTNDWNNIDEEAFKQNCKEFYETISRKFSRSKIFTITPIWRKDMHEERSFGVFKNVEHDIREAVKNLENVTVLSGFDFVPKDEKFYADFRLHPNDEGFSHYVENLYEKMKTEL